MSVTTGGGSSSSGGSVANVQIAKAQPMTDGTAGWRVAGDLGTTQSDYAEVDGSYRTGVGQISATALQAGRTTTETAQFDGSIGVLIGRGGVAAAPGNKVDGAFAIVDAGASGVAIKQDNHDLGATNWWGQFLVPNMRPYDRNQIGIGAAGQSVDFDVAETDQVVVPRGHTGVLVKFNGSGGRSAALVSFVGADGKPLRLGVKGRVEGAGGTFIVGYDGKAYVRGLTPGAASVVIDLLDHDCRATFDFAPVERRQTILRGVPCL
jgi:outer membrane usher protein